MGFIRNIAERLSQTFAPAAMPPDLMGDSSQGSRGGGREILPLIPGAPWTGEVNDLLVGDQLQWNVEAVLSALSAHDQGNFFQSGLLCDYMLRDDRIFSASNTRTMGIQGLEFSAEPADENNAIAVERGKLLEADWPYICPPSVIEEAIRWEAMMGFALFQIIVNTNGKRWIPQLKLMHPTYMWYEPTLRVYVLNTESGPAYIEPGNGKWVLFSRHGLYRAWIHGNARSTWAPWMSRQYTYRDRGRFNEVHGQPLRLAKVPSNASDTDKQQFWAAVRNIGSKAVMLAPFDSANPTAGFGIELVEAANTQSWQTFDAAMRTGDEAINLAWLGQNKSGGSDKGTAFSNDAKSAQTVRDEYKVADVQLIEQTMFEQVVRCWSAWNFGEDGLAPKPKYAVEPDEDQGIAATTMKTAAEGLTLLSALGGTIDTQKAIDQYSLPLMAGSQLRAPAPVAAAPTTAPTQTVPAPTMALSKGGRDPMDSLVAGQTFVDSVGDRSIALASKAYGRDVLPVVLDAIRTSDDFDQLRVKLLHAFPQMDLARVQAILSGALKIATGAGAFTARREAQTKDK